MRNLRCLTTLLAVLTAVFSQAAHVSFDLRPAKRLMKSGAVSKSVVAAGELRTTSLAAGKTQAEPLQIGDELSFQLFDDVAATLKLTERVESPLGGATFLAEMSGYDGLKNAVVSQVEDGLQVNIQDFKKGRVYAVVSTASGTTVREFDPKAEKIVPTEPVIPKAAIQMASGSVGGVSPSGVSEQPSTVVDMLVAFDCHATTYANQNGGGITNFANMAVAKMNTALANDNLGTSFRFRLVGAMSVGVSSDDVHECLAALDEARDGWRAIREMRETVGADIVTTLIDTGSAFGTTGLGWSLEKDSDIGRFADYAYNVCAIRSVAQSHTMTHEVGHNMGAGHPDASLQTSATPGPQRFDYSSGYYFHGADGNAYRTIMAYDDDGRGNRYDEAPLFSSPDCLWAGAVAGDATHDNARTIRNTYSSVAAWRKQKIALSYDVFFSPETETLFTDSVTVTLTPGKAGLPIRYTTDGSVPTLSSPLYSSPLCLKNTTTIKAATVTDGNLGPVYEARYLKSDLGTALNSPQLNWTTSSDYPWVTQTDYTFDGFAVQSSPSFIDSAGCGKTSWIKATVTGPTEMGFRYQKRQHASVFNVYCDDQVVWNDNVDASCIGPYYTWNSVTVSLPAGTHEIKFAFEQGWGYYRDVFNGIVLDTICFDAWSAMPRISPETTAVQSTATTFAGSMTVTLTPPEGRTGKLFYTLDGSDPTQEGALPYAGPFTIEKSVFVQAVFVESGREASSPAQGYFLERHPVLPGEWTTDVEGAKKAAKENDGKLIAVLSANRGGCWWSQQFMPIAESPEFLSWARANGIYLITSDASELVDTDAADDYFRQLWRGGTVYYPTIVFARPANPDDPLSWGCARNDGSSVLGGVLYRNTVESLIDGFAAVLGGAVPKAPTVSPESEMVDNFPLTVTLTNPNGSGTIYYTLDGAEPTRSAGIAYSGPIIINSAATVLKAAVWNASDLSSPVIVKTYRTISEWVNGVFGASGITWQKEGSVDWMEASESKTLRTGGLLSGDSYTSTLKATVKGKGRFVFNCQACSCTAKNTIEFSINGETKWMVKNSWERIDKGIVPYDVDSDGETTFEWTYRVTVPGSDYTSGYVETSSRKSIWCGVWLSNVQWIPEEAASVTEKGVEFSWLDANFPSTGTRTPEQYAALENEDPDNDGFKNWEEYLCGTDPNSAAISDPDGVPQCVIEMDGVLPRISHNIHVPEAAQAQGWRAKVVGSNDLKSWAVADETVHHYFKVVVSQD